MEGKKNKEKDEEPMLIPIGTQGKWVMCVSEMAACRSLFALFFKVYDGTMYIRWPTGIATLSFRERGRDKVDVRPCSNRKKKGESNPQNQEEGPPSLPPSPPRLLPNMLPTRPTTWVVTLLILLTYVAGSVTSAPAFGAGRARSDSSSPPDS